MSGRKLVCVYVTGGKRVRERDIEAKMRSSMVATVVKALQNEIAKTIGITSTVTSLLNIKWKTFNIEHLRKVFGELKQC